MWVDVKEMGEKQHLTARRVRTQIVGKLEKSGFSVVDAQRYSKEIQRRIDLARAKEEFKKAALLSLQRKALTGFRLELIEARRWEDTVDHGLRETEVTNYLVELSATVVDQDTAEVIGSVMGRGAVQEKVDKNVPRWTDASGKAVEEIYPKLRNALLGHWMKNLDVGRAMLVQVFGCDAQMQAKIRDRLRERADVTKARLTNTAAIPTIRLLGRLEAQDIFDMVLEWEMADFKPEVVGPNLVTINAVGARHTEAGEARRKSSDGWPGKAKDGKNGAGEGAGSGRQSSTPNYVLPAAILGGGVLTGILLAALILKKGR
jgi:hypothetical protein